MSVRTHWSRRCWARCHCHHWSQAPACAGGDTVACMDMFLHTRSRPTPDRASPAADTTCGCPVEAEQATLQHAGGVPLDDGQQRAIDLRIATIPGQGTDHIEPEVLRRDGERLRDRGASA